MIIIKSVYLQNVGYKQKLTMENGRKYFFNYFSSLIDVCKDGHEPVPDMKYKSFLWDEDVKGITLQCSRRYTASEIRMRPGPSG